MIFSIFWLSPAGESQFSLLFRFPSQGKTVFCCFLVFPHKEKLIFAEFWFSPVRESWFSLFFIHPRPRTANLSYFLSIRGLGQSRSNTFDTWHATENEKAVESCLTFNHVEFGTIRIGIIQLFPNTEKLHRITVTEPVGEKGPPPLARSISVRLIWSTGIALLLNIQIDWSGNFIFQS